TPTATRTLAPIGTPPPPLVEDSIVDEPVVPRRSWRAVAGIVIAGLAATGGAIYVASQQPDRGADVHAFVTAEAASAPASAPETAPEPDPVPVPEAPKPPVVAPIVEAPAPPPTVARHSHHAPERHA